MRSVLHEGLHGCRAVHKRPATRPRTAVPTSTHGHAEQGIRQKIERQEQVANDFQITSEVGAENPVAMEDLSNGHGFEMTMGPEAVHTVGSFEDDDIAEPAMKYPAGNSSAAGAVANFVNIIVGAGIIGLPFALAKVCSMEAFD